MKITYLSIFTAIFLTLPTSLFAQETDDLRALVIDTGEILQLLLPIVFTLAVVAFMFGIVRLLFTLISGGETEGQGAVLFWGIVALFVMTSIWGIVDFAGNLFGIEQGGEGPVPGIEQ